MEICRKKERNIVPYGDVQRGQVFEVDGVVFLKTDLIYTDTGDIVSSISLSTGLAQKSSFFSEDKVTLLNATLVIED